jgi:hypothetical protein
VISKSGLEIFPTSVDSMAASLPLRQRHRIVLVVAGSRNVSKHVSREMKLEMIWHGAAQTLAGVRSCVVFLFHNADRWTASSTLPPGYEDTRGRP